MRTSVTISPSRARSPSKVEYASVIHQLGQANAHVSTHSGANSSNVQYFGRRGRNPYSLSRSKDAIAIHIIGYALDRTTDTIIGHYRLSWLR